LDRPGFGASVSPNSNQFLRIEEKMNGTSLFAGRAAFSR
jgi:hypothetical protein